MHRFWKQSLTALLILALIVSFVPSVLPRAAAESEHPTLNWELKTIDGGTINQNTFGDKLVLLVFFQISGCQNSNGTVTSLASSTLMNNPDLQIVFAEFDGYDPKYIKQYLDSYGVNYTNQVVAYDGRTLAFQLSNMIDGDGSVTLSNCAIIRGNEVLDYWEGNYYVSQIKQHQDLL